MGVKQEWATRVGMTVAAAMLAYPPWMNIYDSPPQVLPTEYRFIFDPPHRHPRQQWYGVYWERLFIQYIIIAAVVIIYDGFFAGDEAGRSTQAQPVPAGPSAKGLPADKRPASAPAQAPASGQTSRVAPTAGSSAQDEPDKRGPIGCAVVLAGLLGVIVYAVLSAPNLKVHPGVALLLYGLMFGIPLVLVLKEAFKGK